VLLQAVNIPGMVPRGIPEIPGGDEYSALLVSILNTSGLDTSSHVRL